MDPIPRLGSFFGFRENDESQNNVTCKECFGFISAARKHDKFTRTSKRWRSYKDPLKSESVDQPVFLAKNLWQKKGPCFIPLLCTFRNHVYLSGHLVKRGWCWLVFVLLCVLLSDVAVTSDIPFDDQSWCADLAFVWKKKMWFSFFSRNHAALLVTASRNI